MRAIKEPKMAATCQCGERRIEQDGECAKCGKLIRISVDDVPLFALPRMQEVWPP